MAASPDEMMNALTRAQDRTDPRARLRAFYALTKPNLTALVVVTAVLGYYLGAHSVAVDWFKVVYLILGTALTSAGACAINMVIERDLDARMRRTRDRPIPSGRVKADEALMFATVLFAWGFFALLIFCGPIPAALALGTGLVYVYVYTPSKKKGPISIWIGAIPGAIPPLMGWSTATGSIGVGGVVLFAILFCWQFPHFLALAYMYREDYARAGFTFVSDDDAQTGRHIALGTVVVLIVSLMLAGTPNAGPVYLGGALLLGLGFVSVGVRAARACTARRARQAFFASIIYLPLLFVALMIDRLFQ